MRSDQTIFIDRCCVVVIREKQSQLGNVAVTAIRVTSGDRELSRFIVPCKLDIWRVQSDLQRHRDFSLVVECPLFDPRLECLVILTLFLKPLAARVRDHTRCLQ